MATVTLDDMAHLSAPTILDKFSVWDVSASEHKTTKIGNMTDLIFSISPLTLLSDTPANYTGAARDLLAVNSTADGVEFIDDIYIDTITLGATSQPSASVPMWIREDDTSSTAITTASLTLERDTEVALHLLTDTDGLCKIYAGDSGDEDAGIITYDHDNAYWEFTTENSAIVRVEAAHFRPVTDNTVDLGSSTQAWKDVYYEGTITDTSDERYKSNIRDEELGLDFINRLKAVTYEKNSEIGRKRHGFIAQDIVAVEPNFSGVTRHDLGDGEYKYTLAYMELIAPMAKAIQELSSEVDKLWKKISIQATS